MKNKAYVTPKRLIASPKFSENHSDSIDMVTPSDIQTVSLDIDKSVFSTLTSPKIQNYHKMFREEVLELVDDIGKMSPLVPEFIYFSSAEIATAVFLVTINYAAKLLCSKFETDKPKICDLRDMYIRVFKITYMKYQMDKQRINKFAITLNEVLIRVNE